jgi:hypothetical protein
MKMWTKETAERTVSKMLGKNKTIILDGHATLGLLSACDYLVNEHGYRYITVAKSK